VVSIDDPIASLLEISSNIGTNSMEVPLDATIFERNSDVPLYIYMTDVLEFVDGGQYLNISIVVFL